MSIPIGARGTARRQRCCPTRRSLPSSNSRPPERNIAVACSLPQLCWSGRRVSRRTRLGALNANLPQRGGSVMVAPSMLLSRYSPRSRPARRMRCGPRRRSTCGDRSHTTSVALSMPLDSCSMPPGISSRSTASWHVRRIWMRSRPRSCPARLTMRRATWRWRRGPHPGPGVRRGPLTSSSTHWLRDSWRASSGRPGPQPSPHEAFEH
jgi:hypothetical protein